MECILINILVLSIDFLLKLRMLESCKIRFRIERVSIRLVAVLKPNQRSPEHDDISSVNYCENNLKF